MPRDRTAGLIVIGNEILSGEVVDSNSAHLARGLRQKGVTLRKIVVVPDELDEIVSRLVFRERPGMVRGAWVRGRRLAAGDG